MKTVFTNDMVAHIWAQQSQPEGRSGNGQFYFRDSTIYSYRDSYPIARFVTNKRGERAVLFRLDSYSITTSHHIGMARGAVHGVPIFTVAHPFDDSRHDDNKQNYQTRINEICHRAARSRTNAEYHIGDAQRLANEANNYAQFFGLRWRVKVLESAPEFLAEARQRAAADAARKAKETKVRAEAKRAELAERIAQWRNGENVSLWNSPDVLLRVVGDEIQTSRGARIPVAHAPRLWRVIQRAIAGTPYQHNGHTEHAGEFRVDSIDTSGTLRAGCHVIKYEELQCIAQQLSLGE